MARRSARVVACIAVMIFALSACSSDTSGSIAGTQVAKLGRQIDISSSGSPPLAALWLDSVESVRCTERGSLPPNNGHYLAVTIVLRTTEEYEPDWGWWMSATDFATYDADGNATGKGIFTSCLPVQRYLPDDFYLADAGYYGVVLLDSSSEHGTLTYKPHNMPAEVTGWRWQY
ncbi:hypothetical protein [Actinokineospora sp.]|uniref:hypothetical protein n=1 Tax=Actinokineospora sp. TaxID=1872133 RepID=UPI0040379E3E